jgi:hypothetical protein
MCSGCQITVQIRSWVSGEEERWGGVLKLR